MHEVEKFILEEIEKNQGSDLRVLIENLDPTKKRLAMFVAICSKKDVWLKKMIKELSSKTAEIDNFIERIRKYIPIGEVEKKSFGEVFTPFELINEMLDTLPLEVWSDPKLKWGDFCNGVGNFMVIVIKRLMKGLETWEPDEDKRYKHIIENMIYVAELQIKNMFVWMVSVDPKNQYNLNLYRGNSLEEDFDKHMKDVWKVEKMDIIIGNPPYNREFQSNNNRVKPLYNEFILKFLPLTIKLLFITPSRWMFDAYGLEKFKKDMLRRKDIKIIQHFNNASDIFDGVEIKGGVSYFLIDKEYDGDVIFNGEIRKTSELNISNLEKSILNKTSIIKNKLSEIIKSQSYYGFPGNESLFTKEKKSINDIKVFVSKNKGLEMWVDKIKIKSKVDISCWKVFTPGAAGSGSKMSFFGAKIIGKPNEVASKSYMVFNLKNESECKNLISYMNTNFCNFLLGTKKKTQNIKPDTLSNIPLVDLSKSWTDEELYQYFELSEDEINLIKNNN